MNTTSYTTKDYLDALLEDASVRVDGGYLRIEARELLTDEPEPRVMYTRYQLVRVPQDPFREVRTISRWMTFDEMGIFLQGLQAALTLF